MFRRNSGHQKVTNIIIFGDVQMVEKRRQFAKKFKLESVRLTVEEGRQIFEYIEVFYNRQRRDSYLGYLSPVDFEKKNAA